MDPLIFESTSEYLPNDVVDQIKAGGIAILIKDYLPVKVYFSKDGFMADFRLPRATDIANALPIIVRKMAHDHALQLAACDCAALLDTAETHEGNKTVTKDNPAWSPAFESVMRRTAECIALRAQLAAAERNAPPSPRAPLQPSSPAWRVQCMRPSCTHTWYVEAAFSISCPVCKGGIYTIATTIQKEG